MKNWITIALSGIGVIGVMFFLTACPGKGSSSTSGEVCTLGYVSTGYGCLPQGNCPLGQGYYAQTGQCVTGTINGGGGYANYTTFTGYQSSFINQWACQDFVGRLTGNYTCTNNISYSLQTATTTLPTPAALGVMINGYFAGTIQGTVQPINNNTQAQFIGQYCAMQVGLRLQGLLTATSLNGTMINNGTDFANVTLNKLY